LLRHRSAWFFPALGRRIRRSSARSNSAESLYSNELMNRTARAEEWRSTNRRHPVRTVVGGGAPSDHRYAFINCPPPSAARRPGRHPCAVCERASPVRRYALSLPVSRQPGSKRGGVVSVAGMGIVGERAAWHDCKRGKRCRSSRGRAAPMSSMAPVRAAPPGTYRSLKPVRTSARS
jgi:hypothetical protein